MMLSPIEIICYYVAQPVVDFLVYLLNDVHYLAFLVAVAVMGILFGLFVGVLTLICMKCQGMERPEKKPQNEQQYESQSSNAKQKYE